jgi:hypothetical protein
MFKNAGAVKLILDLSLVVSFFPQKPSWISVTVIALLTHLTRAAGRASAATVPRSVWRPWRAERPRPRTDDARSGNATDARPISDHT